MEQIMRNLTLSFFSSSDMALIYPNLFRLLWWPSRFKSPIQQCCSKKSLSLVFRYIEGFENIVTCQKSRYSALPCSPLPGIAQQHLLSRCEWRGKIFFNFNFYSFFLNFFLGKIVDCADIFETSPTDSGMCCSFNMEKTLRWKVSFSRLGLSAELSGSLATWT